MSPDAIASLWRTGMESETPPRSGSVDADGYGDGDGDGFGSGDGCGSDDGNGKG